MEQNPYSNEKVIKAMAVDYKKLEVKKINQCCKVTMQEIRKNIK
mgnify:FL=1